MHKTLRTFFQLLLAVGLCLAGSCTPSPDRQNSPTDNSSPRVIQPTSTIDPAIQTEIHLASRSFQLGTAGFVPRNYPDSTDEDWADFFQNGAASYGGLYGVHVNPGDQPDQDGIPQQISLAFENMSGVEPYVAFAVNFEEGPFTDTRGEQLRRAAVATAEKYQPRYLSLGVESNSFYLFERDSYDLYVQYAREIYQEIKDVSPNTLVTNNFQLDRMRGKTDLTGQSFPPHWELISRFEGKIDLVSFTVYPFLHYKTPEEIPEDYLLEIRNHTNLPVMITESGWPTTTTISGVEGSERDQIDYLIKLIHQADQLGVTGIIWVFPHDASFGIAGGIFDTISIKYNDGNPKPAFRYWTALQSLPDH
jgi:hypothetical protein